jgi:hypothetical protein
MTAYFACDYCGEAITADDLMAKIEARGDVPSTRFKTLDSELLNVDFGHYHTEPLEPGQSSCYDHMRDAIHLAHEFGASVERIPTISPQAVAARRRKHRRAD